MSDSTLSLPNVGIETFFGLKDLTKYNLMSIHLESNHLENFEHFGSHADLAELCLENNRISSFQGMTKQRSLQRLHLKGNPIASHPQYRIMALLTIGFSLQRIDDFVVQPTERELARKLGPNAALAVSYGWLIDLAPLTEDDFATIIMEQRNKRKAQLKQNLKKVTILSVLDSMVKDNSGSPQAPPRPEQSTTRPTNDDAEVNLKAITHLTQRIRFLEQELAHSQMELQKHRMPAPVPTAGQEYRGITELDMKSIETVVFAQGLSFQGSLENIGTSTHRVAVVVSKEDLVIVQLFDRSRMLELPLHDCTIRPDSTHRALIITTTSGQVYRITCTSELLLCVLYKAICLRTGDVFPRQIFSLAVQKATTMEILPEDAPPVVEPDHVEMPPKQSATAQVIPPVVADPKQVSKDPDTPTFEKKPVAIATEQNPEKVPPQQQPKTSPTESPTIVSAGVKAPPPKIVVPPQSTSQPTATVAVPAQTKPVAAPTTPLQPAATTPSVQSTAAPKETPKATPTSKYNIADLKVSDSDDDDDTSEIQEVKRPAWRGKDVTTKGSHSDSD